jgi:SNF2 family DNA or RNA helicase
MRLRGIYVNYTPAFSLPTEQDGFWRLGFGSVKRKGEWIYPAYYPFGEWALRDLRKLDPKLELDTSAWPFEAELRDAATWVKRSEAEWAEGKEVTLPKDWKFEIPPYNHQRLGIIRMLYSKRSFFLWEMGTGKTRTVVEGVKFLRREGRFRKLLVIGPKVILPTWEREVGLWAPGELKVLLWRDSDKHLPEKAAEADVVVATYGRAREEWASSQKEGRESRLQLIDYDSIVADESHYLGDFESQQTQACLELSSKALLRVLLTGTAADHPKNLYSQLRFLSPALMPYSWTEFQDKHLVYASQRKREKGEAFTGKDKHLVVGFKFLQELNARVDLVASRMRKADCLDLPEMTFVDVPFDLAPNQRARYNELVLQMRASEHPDMQFAEIEADADGQVADDNVPSPYMPQMMGIAHGASRVLKCLQVVSGFLINGPDMTICDGCPNVEHCAEKHIKPYTKKCEVVQTAPPKEIIRDIENPKAELFEDLLRNILDADSTNKVLCWASFRPELDDMVAICKKLGVGYVRVDGSNTDRIKEWEDEFQGNPKCRVYVGQVASGIGITLTAANYAIYYSLPWNRKQYNQSLERNNRPGQTRKMTVYRIIARDTFGEFIAKSLQFKESIAYSLTEQVACARCDRGNQERCAREQNHPFRRGCIYQDSVARPVAKATVVGKTRLPVVK